MNIIRTTAVELSTIPGIGYKQKLAAGGSGIKIFRLDKDASAVGTIDRRSGEVVAYGKVDEDLFPAEAFEEAVELTKGMPFSARGKIVIKAYETKEAEDVTENEEEELPSMVGSVEYDSLIARYSDEKGRVNFKLMNKDFIQFASKSKVVNDMVADKNDENEILAFVIKSRAAFAANQKDNLDDKSVQALIATLDEIETRSAFKELKIHIRKMLSKRR